MSNVEGAVQNLFTRLNQCLPDVFEAGSENPNLQFIIGGLTNKALSHCEIAKDMTIKSRFSEAVVLLRSSYEAVVIAHYLHNNPGKASEYQQFSLLVEYKNRLAIFHKPDWKDSALAKKTLLRMKNEILEKRLLDNTSYFRGRSRKDYKKHFADKTILDRPEELSKSLNNHFFSFERMKDSLIQELPEEYGTLYDSSALIYNVGSQVVHAHWHTVLDYNLGVDGEGKEIKPTFGPSFIYAGLIILVMYSLKVMDAVGLTTSVVTELNADLVYAQTETLTEITQNRVLETEVIHPVLENTPKGREIIKKIHLTRDSKTPNT